ncbi:bifunctional phosphatase PAP2/diacylglycerol kinase family protein [Nocardia sp. KC 131]|uniref:bifunctional phosphatase PAP2/diacylglycerol kinase family protein n=1 Tax=Nocardia arseniciresistens TaxID=3392119 RepID=UPI00398E97F0
MRRRKTGTSSTQPKGLTNGLDRLLVDRSARVRPTSADRFLRALSMSANHSRLWVGVAAGLVVVGGRAPRRGAVRGLLAVGVASAVANGIAKPLFPRRRPPDESVPFVRRLVSPPVSSSFPSGHAASAAAFVTGVALESPAAGAVVAPIALAVGYSRVHIGVHWPSDVVAGALLGGAIALTTRRWWAARPDDPATLGPVTRIEPVLDGNGLLLVGNPQSGSGAGDEVLQILRKRLPAAQVLELEPDIDLAARIDDLLSRERIVALGVLGGDGTVSSVAAAAVEHRLPLAVFAGGTLNHFARDAGVEDMTRTLDALDAGETVLIDTAHVQFDRSEPRTFINTASLGGYPDFVRMRERWEARLGKWPAAGIAMVRLLFGAQPLHATIDGASTAIWMLFVGNGGYHPSHQIPMSRPEIHRGTLDIRYLRADVAFSRTRLIWATLTGTLERSATYVHRRADRLDVGVADFPVSLATDGEVDHRGKDFTFTSQPAALTLFRPYD